ncbi:MAG: efflux RND transporter periplasmic adaptor subunit [Kiritimatiellia bacterium]
MKWIKRLAWILPCLLLAGGGFFYWQTRGSGAANGGGAPASFRTVEVGRRDIVRTVSATGTVTPRNTSSGIPVGAQVNGKLVKLYVDYNDVVTNGQVVALIDPLVYEATYKSAVAKLHVDQASVQVAACTVRQREAELVLAKKTYDRKKALVEKSMAPVADLDSATEAYEKAQATVESAKASLQSARANVEASQASVDQAKANLGYCTIRSPVNGIVIARKVEEGETVVSSMNAVPVLSIAEDLDVIWVEATVPEADVGNIRVGQAVTFTADAYRDHFTGRVRQIRRAATTTNNVVTFPVIIEAENPGQKLFPGMTATLSIETARAENVLAVAAAAFRFRPKEADYERARAGGEIPRGRKLWFANPDGSLTYARVEEGVSDDSFVELRGDGVADLAGREAVVGYHISGSAGAAGEARNPFMPKFPKRGTKGTAPEPKAKGK